jgi:hypothetical protein
MAKRKQESRDSDTLKGWREIAAFLELPVSTAHRWAKEGMPVNRQGRHIYASRQSLREWLSNNRSGASIAVVSNKSDLTAEIQRSLRTLKRKRAA